MKIDQVTNSTTGVEEVAVSIAKRVGLLLSSIAIQSLLAYALLPEGRGMYAVCIIFAGIVAMLFTPGANIGAQYLVISGRLSVSEGLCTALIVCLLGAGAGIALGVLLIHSDLSFFRQAESRTFYLALMLVPATSFSSAVQHQLAGLRRFGRLAFYSLSYTAVHGLAAGTLVFGLGFGVDGAVLALLCGELVMIALCVRYLRREKTARWSRPTWRMVGDVVRYGLKYHGARIAGHVDVRIGVLVLGMLANQVEIGFFAVASGLMMRVGIVSDSMVASLVPRFAKAGGDRQNLGAFCTRTSVLITFVLLGLLLAFSSPVVRILLSVEFLPIVPLLWIIAPGVFVLSGANVVSSFFRATNRPQVCSIAALVGLLINLIALPFLYLEVGISGAAIAMSAGLVARGVWLGSTYCRQTRTRPAQLLFPQSGDVERIRSFVEGAIARLSERVR